MNLRILDVLLRIVPIFVIEIGLLWILEVKIILESALLIDQYLVCFVYGSSLEGGYWNSSVVSYCLFLSGWYFFAMSLNAFFIVAVSAVFLTPSSL